MQKSLFILVALVSVFAWFNLALKHMKIVPNNQKDVCEVSEKEGRQEISPSLNK